MAEYHVGCGAFGIYAGTLEPRNKNLWRNKSEVTEEAVAAVVQYYKQELEIKGKKEFHTQYEFRDGTYVDLDISIANAAELADNE